MHDVALSWQETSPGASRLALSGACTMRALPAMLDALARRRGAPETLDLSALEALDSREADDVANIPVRCPSRRARRAGP